MGKKVIKIILPLVHTWGTIILLFNYIIKIFYFNKISLPGIFWFTPVIPIIFSEILMSKHYDGKNIFNLKDLPVILTRIIFWTFLSLFMINAIHDNRFSWILIPKQVFFIKYLIYTRYRLVLYLVSIYCILYYLFVVRKRLFRLTITFFLPVWFFFIAFRSYSLDKGLEDINRINRQKNVEVVFELKEIKSWVRNHYSQYNKPGVKYSDWWMCPRQIQVEGDIIYASYGCDNYYDFNLPCFFKLNSATREIDAIFKRTVKTFGIDPKSNKAYIGLWSPGEIVAFDRYNLKELFSTGFSSQFGWFELLSFYLDSENDIIYVALSRINKIVKYDLKSKKTLGILDLKNLGIVLRGEIWKMEYVPSLNKLYVLIFGGEHSNAIIELAPDEFKITKLLTLPGEGAAMAFDKQKNTLLVSGFFDDKMWEVDISTYDYKIINTYNIPFGIRRIYIDQQGEKLFLISYVSGKLFVFSRKSGRIEKEYLIGEKADACFVSGDYIYTSSDAGIIRIKYR